MLQLVTGVFVTSYVLLVAVYIGYFLTSRRSIINSAAFWAFWGLNSLVLAVCFFSMKSVATLPAGITFLLAAFIQFSNASYELTLRQRRLEWEFIEAAWKPVPIERILAAKEQVPAQTVEGLPASRQVD